MPNLSYDGQSFFIDARRIWLVSASLAYSQIAPHYWPAAIAAARQSGMNCIEVVVPWRIHEPQHGKFHFSGQANLRKFVQLIIAQGMYVIVRPGPYTANNNDLGGMPSWLLAQPDIQLRQANPAFLQASARYLGKVMAQIHDLQITSPRLDDAPEINPDGSQTETDDSEADAPLRKANPTGIVMIQAEHQWLCHHPDQSNKYLTQIVRYLRENNCQVPISLSNNLWQQVDGTLDTWHASTHLAADLRQLRMIQSSSPRFVSHLAPAANVNELLTQLTCVTAVGGQFNLDPFCASSGSQVNQGRTLTPASSAIDASTSPVFTSNGDRSDRYHTIKRIATLASQFGHVLAHAQPASQPAALLPEVNNPASQLTILQQQGSQGTLIFLIKSAGCKTTVADILLPDGQTLPVPLGNDATAWIGADINLSGVAQLTLTNLRPWAWIAKKMLVLYGPAEAQGLVVLDGASLTFNVPSAKQAPAVLHHDDITVVILNEKQVDTAYPTPQGLVVNVAVLDENHQPVTNANSSKSPAMLIDLTGGMTSLKPDKTKDSIKSTKLPTLSNWQRLDLSAMLTGKSESYKPIEQLAPMEAQGDDTAACWYHLRLKSPVAAIPTLVSPASGGRLHFYTNQKHTGTLEAQHHAKIKLAKEFVVLATNPGRYADGWRMNEPIGIAGDLYAIKPLKLAKPKITSQVLDSPLTFRPYLQDIRHEHREMAQTLTWSLSLRSKTPRLFAWENFPHRSMLLVNGQIVGVYDPALSDHAQQVLLEMDAPLRSGTNELTLAILEPLETLTAASAASMLKQIKLYEVTRILTDKAEVRYAKWELPEAQAFDETSAKSKSTSAGSGPCWRRSTFECGDTTANLELTLSAAAGSQVYLNHHHLGRVSDSSDKHTFVLPASWLHNDKPNELLFFDAQPGKTIIARLHK